MVFYHEILKGPSTRSALTFPSRILGRSSCLCLAAKGARTIVVLPACSFFSTTLWLIFYISYGIWTYLFVSFYAFL